MALVGHVSAFLLVCQIIRDHVPHLFHRGADVVLPGQIGGGIVDGFRDNQRPVGHPEDEADAGKLSGVSLEVQEDLRTVDEPRAALSPGAGIRPASEGRHVHSPPPEALHLSPGARDVGGTDEERIDVACQSQVAAAGRIVAYRDPLGPDLALGEKLAAPRRGDQQQIDETLSHHTAQGEEVRVDIGGPRPAERDLADLSQAQRGPREARRPGRGKRLHVPEDDQGSIAGGRLIEPA
jgi:hypothetical protein